jgi:hypothetical protein
VLDHTQLALPTLSLGLQAVVRAGYGALMVLTLGAALPHSRRYFQSERWGGYAASSPSVDAIQNPIVGSLVLAVWIAAALCLVAGDFVLTAAAINLVCCYYFFVQMRWGSVLRGMGAPGFIAFWLAAAVFLLELTTRHAPGLRSLTLFTLQIDFAAIMLTAGVYKLVAGYRRGMGMELGLANPEWGYWPEFWATWRPTHPLFRLFNELAWGTEVTCGILMLIPPTRMVGGLGILLSFIFIATQIRLGFLCEMVMVCCLLFFGVGTAAESWLLSVLPAMPGFSVIPGTPLPASVQAAVAICLWAYIGFLPIVRGAMFYNQLRHRSLPGALQRLVDSYANVFGLILWRVFTADVVNFFVRVWEEPGSGAARRLISHYRRTGPFRFSQVAECITLTSIFTTLKYYPSNPTLFVQRLLRYARTIPGEPSSRLVFEWVHVATTDKRFAHVPIAEYTVDLSSSSVTVSVLSDTVSVHAVAGASPVHEGVTPGSYAPLK